jgi:hypothetical protein
LSGANLVPLGGQVRAGFLPSSMQHRSSVFNRISFPVRHRVDQSAIHSTSQAQFARRANFQNLSKFSNDRLERPNSWSSLRGSRACPWASRNLIWRPKKISKQHQEISKNKSVLSINGASDHGSDDSRSLRDNSFSGNNCQLFGFPGQNCKRDFLSFPSMFEDVSWEFPPAAVVQVCSSLACGWAFSPALFNNFGEFAQAVLPRSGSSPSTELALFTKPSSSSLPWAILSLLNPHLWSVCSSCQRIPPSEVSEGMAFHRVDPAPFIPHGFMAQQVDHREIMVRTVTRPQPSAHEDWGIVLVQPLPEHEVNFHFFDDIIREYLLEVRHVQIRSIQCSHLGQDLVRFRFAFDRDNLVALGPQQALGFSFTVIRHNEAWNQRALYFNHECWLLLLGFPLDFWTHEHIQNAIGSFGRVLMWDPDPSNVTRLLVRVRVTSLQEVPQFIVFSVAEGFQGVSWTVQCDIVQQFMLGAQPQDEDPVPPYPHDGH